MRQRLAILTVGLLLLAAPPPAESQQTGTITGSALDAQTGAPVPSVQVFIAGEDLGVLTQQNGRFLLQNVPTGTHTLTAERIGYRTQSAEVSVTAGQTVVQDFSMTEQALQLDEVVVTGVAGGTRSRAVGNDIGQVEAGEVTQQSPISGVENMMVGRVSGLAVLPTGGDVGASGGGVRIRGHSSLSLSNQPLIFVDGVRVNNASQAGPRAHGGAHISVLSDFNPEDIESIEIIKGPSASTLYGTEASAGVIQIITKRGQTGAPEFSAMVRQGALWLHNPEFVFPDGVNRDPVTNEKLRFNLIEQENAAGRSPFRYGHQQTYNLGIRGGTDLIRYYVSGEWDSQEGYIDWNYTGGLSLRSNVSIIPNDEWTIDTSLGYTDGETSLGQQRDAYGLMEQIFWSDPTLIDTPTRGYLRAPPEDIGTIEAIRQYGRLTGSMSITNTPLEWLTHRLAVGLDRTDEVSWQFIPRHPDGAEHYFGSLSLGHKEQWTPRVVTATLDYGATADFAITESIGSRFSTGIQYYSFDRREGFAQADVFASPALSTLSSGAVTQAQESFVENKSLGVYVQEEVSYQDRIFVTAAVRGDDNSAFGADFDAAIYPKFSATWVISEEEFFPTDIVNSLRLRGAWGQAGRQPDAFAAEQLFAPGTGPNGQGVVAPTQIGNPDLGPEVSSEIEVGFDMALLDDRASVVYTYYDGTTEDAILNVDVSASLGYPAARQTNIGQISNWGHELEVRGRVLERSGWSWDLGVNLNYNDNRVDDLGGVPAPSGDINEGYPFPALFDKRIYGADEAERRGDPAGRPPPALDYDPVTGTTSNVMCYSGTGEFGLDVGGDAVPCAQAPDLFTGRVQHPWNISASTTVGIGENLRLSALFDLRWGGWFNSRDLCTVYGFGHTEANIMSPEEVLDDYDAQIFLASLSTSGVERWGCDVPAGFGKFRNISANYSLPQRFAGVIGADRASIQVGLNNPPDLYREYWRDPWGRRVASPDRRRTGGELTNTQRANLPPSTTFMATVRVTW